MRPGTFRANWLTAFEETPKSERKPEDQP